MIDTAGFGLFGDFGLDGTALFLMAMFEAECFLGPRALFF